jgi:hypothetical protein
MPFTAQELANIANSALDFYMGKGEVYAQAIQNKPMMRAFDSNARNFSGGKGFVSLAVKSGQGGLNLTGYTHDDQVNYGNPASTKRINFPWKEHFIGMGLTHTELKHDGITVTESGADQSTSNKDGREEHALANILEEKVKDMNEDYAVAWDSLIHGDGSSDTKALAGIRAFILDDVDAGSTGGLSRVTNTWWRNRARTTATGGTITSNPANGGALLQFLQTEQRQLDRFASNRRSRKFAGSDFIGAIETELRANGNYAQTGFARGGDGTIDGSMPAVRFAGVEIVYDPTLDNLGLSKRMYDIDMNAIKLVYMTGEKMKKANPARPHDRFVMYQGMTSTAVMVAQRLNSSGVYDIA